MNKNKIYFKELKRINKEHQPDKHSRRKPYNWIREWGPFIKYDADWDGAYLLDLIIYKLERMYLALDTYSDEVREILDPKLKVLRETIDLGKKILTHEYDTDYHAWGLKHCSHVIYIYKKGEFIKGQPIHKIVQWHKDDVNDEDPFDHLEDYFGTKAVAAWAKENGYNPKDLTTAYGGEWDDKANYKVWKQKVKAAAKAKQKDIDEFFKLIARNYRGWWY